MTVEERWGRVERLILLHTMPGAKEDQVAAALDLALEGFDAARRAKGCRSLPNCVHQGGSRLCITEQRARIAALPDRVGEGRG